MNRNKELEDFYMQLATGTSRAGLITNIYNLGNTPEQMLPLSAQIVGEHIGQQDDPDYSIFDMLDYYNALDPVYQPCFLKMLRFAHGDRASFRDEDYTIMIYTLSAVFNGDAWTQDRYWSDAGAHPYPAFLSEESHKPLLLDIFNGMENDDDKWNTLCLMSRDKHFPEIAALYDVMRTSDHCDDFVNFYIRTLTGGTSNELLQRLLLSLDSDIFSRPSTIPIIASGAPGVLGEFIENVLRYWRGHAYDINVIKKDTRYRQEMGIIEEIQRNVAHSMGFDLPDFDNVSLDINPIVFNDHTHTLTMLSDFLEEGSGHLFHGDNLGGNLFAVFSGVTTEENMPKGLNENMIFEKFIFTVDTALSYGYDMNRIFSMFSDVCNAAICKTSSTVSVFFDWMLSEYHDLPLDFFIETALAQKAETMPPY